MDEIIQDIVLKLGVWSIIGLSLFFIQSSQADSRIHPLSLEEAFYRTSLYEENYILPMHYIFTEGEIAKIPLPTPEVPEHLKRKSLAAYKKEFNRKSMMIRDRYRYVNNKEVAFQTSLKVPLVVFTPTHTQFYFGYTSRSWWQSYTGVSAFFREIEQKADFFIEQPFFLAKKTNVSLHFEKLKIGFLHHSNGEGWEFERSWNRVYVALFLKWFSAGGRGGLMLKRWYVLDTPDKRNYNKDIEEYMGNTEMTLSFERRYFCWMMRLQKNSTQCVFNFPLSRSLYGMIYYFHGYGSTIGLYNTACHSIGIGFQAKH